MMLAGKDQPFHSRSRRSTGDLFRIEVSRVEQCRRLISITPFFAGEGVDGEMDESVEFHFMPAELPG
jgi:hypothetical protein